jgi:hypothetical protein
MTDRLEQNKQIVMAFYDLMFNQCQPAEAIERYVGDATFSITPPWLMARRHLLGTLRGWRRSTPASASTSSG